MEFSDNNKIIFLIHSRGNLYFNQMIRLSNQTHFD